MNDQTNEMPLAAPDANSNDTNEVALTAPDPVREKLADAQTPGYQAEFDPDEADIAGAFAEDALTEADALASTHDTPHFGIPFTALQP